MPSTLTLTPAEMALRAHDVTVCMEGSQAAEYAELPLLGMAVRLALHLRGLPIVPYELLKQVAFHILGMPSTAVRTVVDILAEAEFVRVYSEGSTIKSVFPDIPYYDGVFTYLGEIAKERGLDEPEQLTLELVNRLASSPLSRETVYNWGAEKKLVDRVVGIGERAAFINARRARGRDVLVSPTYFTESARAYADLAAEAGASRIKKALDILQRFPGWPLSIMERDREIGGIRLTNEDLRVMRALAGEGFVAPPAIDTPHAGLNHFLFGPRPNQTRLPVSKRPVYEAAIALVAAVRQGQLLPARFAIHSPLALLRAFHDRGSLRANTEAVEQYRKVVAMRVARLEVDPTGQWATLRLIDHPENYEAVQLAMQLLSGEQPGVTPDEQAVMSLREGGSYLESLLGQKRLRERTDQRLPPDEETQQAIETYILQAIS